MESPDSYMASKRKAARDRTVRADGLFTDDHSVFQPDFFDIVSLFSWSFSVSYLMNQMLGYGYQFETFDM